MVQTSFPHVRLHRLSHNSGFAAGTNTGLRLAGFDFDHEQQGRLSPAPPTPIPGRGGTDSPSPLGEGRAGDGLGDEGAGDEWTGEGSGDEGAGDEWTGDEGSSPDYVLLLNPDTVVHAGAIETLVAFLDQHPRVGVASPRLLNPDGTIQAAAFRFPTLSMTLLDLFPPGEVLPGRLYGSWWHGRYPQEQAQPTSPPSPFPIDHPLGACMLVRRTVLEEVGLLDEGYFMYSEEVEWCWRVRQAGWAIWQVPQAIVTHVGGASTSQFRHRMFLELHRSRVRFFKHHYSPRFRHLHRAITRAGMLRATLRCWFQYAQRQITREELRARLWAYGAVVGQGGDF
jgi:GT2 family glycosyltransferase